MLSHTPRPLVAPTEPYPPDRATWQDQVRPQVMSTFGEQIYGEQPDGDIALTWQVLEEGGNPGKPGTRSRSTSPGRSSQSGESGEPGTSGRPSKSAHGQVRRQIALRLTGPLGEMTITLLAYLPAVRTAVVPAFLGLNFLGNHTTTTDPRVLRTERPECGDGSGAGVRQKVGLPSRRGSKRGQWPYRLATDRGYAVITASYLQVGPDHGRIFFDGPNRLFVPAPAGPGAAGASGASGAAGAGHAADARRTAGAGRTAAAGRIAAAGRTAAAGVARTADRSIHRWGAIGMWAWALSRVMDALQMGMIPEVDPTRVMAMGHSRLGKTALWAAASDERFAAAISNNSGCMGAAASREVGETPEVLARVRPYWFAPAFARQVLGGLPLPVDQHQLLAAIAPRPLYVASASTDHNADPQGEFASWHAAREVWGLYGYPVGPVSMPGPGGAVSAGGAPLGYHLRAGGHGVEVSDWHHWLDFADRWVAQRPRA